MIDSLVRVSLMLFAMMIGGFGYFKIDCKYDITNKMSWKLSIKLSNKKSLIK